MLNFFTTVDPQDQSDGYGRRGIFVLSYKSNDNNIKTWVLYANMRIILSYHVNGGLVPLSYEQRMAVTLLVSVHDESNSSGVYVLTDELKIRQAIVE
jgi:hypothetical protein